MTVAEQLADFAVRARFDELSETTRHQLMIRVLDALGCAIGALDGEPIQAIRKQLTLFDGAPVCTLVGGQRTAPDRAAFANTALVRYLDFNDSYLSKVETCHPSDNLGAVLAAAEYAGKSGRDLLTALAVAYQVQCRLSDVAPVRAKGFDHTTQGSYAVAAGVSKALGLDACQAANAIGVCGAAFNALRVTRTDGLSNWAGLAYANTAFGCTHSTFLAMLGITGPLKVFEGTYGFMNVISGPFDVDWAAEPLDAVTRTHLKKYDADIHAQTALEGILDLCHSHGIRGDDVDRIDVDTYDVAYNIIGGGNEGERMTVHTKEQADHSLPYLIAVAILDGQVLPEQYQPERIVRSDVQTLLRKVTVQRDGELSQLYPDQMPCRIKVRLKDGRAFTVEKLAYEGFFTQPMRWETVVAKFERLSEPYTDAALRRDLAWAVKNLETVQVADLMRLLTQVRVPGTTTRKAGSRRAL